VGPPINIKLLEDIALKAFFIPHHLIGLPS